MKLITSNRLQKKRIDLLHHKLFLIIKKIFPIRNLILLMMITALTSCIAFDVTPSLHVSIDK